MLANSGYAEATRCLVRGCRLLTRFHLAAAIRPECTVNGAKLCHFGTDKILAHSGSAICAIGDTRARVMKQAISDKVRLPT
jgi:hypothetical protein